MLVVCTKLGVVEEIALYDHLVGRNAVIPCSDLEQRSLVHGIGDRFAHTDIVKRRLGAAGVERPEGPAGIAAEIDVGVFVVPNRRHLVQRDVRGVVVASAQSERTVSHFPQVEFDRVDIGLTFHPVIREFRTLQRQLRDPFLKDKGACADRLGDVAVPALGFGRDDPGLCNQVEEGRERRSQLDHERVIVGCRETLDLLHRGGQPAARDLVADAFEVGHNVGGGHFAAVVELDALTDLEAVGEAVG